MSLEARTDEMRNTPSFYEKIAACTLKPYEQVVRVSANTGTGSYTVRLPPVALAKGKWYSIVATIANSTTVTIDDNNDSQNWTADASLTVTGHKCLAYSDGMTWHIVKVTA